MLFVHQQIQSFLNLGGCKESIMAKPKLPKKNNSVNEVVPAPNSPAASSTVNLGANLGSQETLAAVTVTERKQTEVRLEPKKTARKPEIVKTEPRSNLVPINLEDEIRRIAYLMSERRGFEPGHEAEDWMAAEREIRQRYHQQSA
jgi:hypothetical protein